MADPFWAHLATNWRPIPKRPGYLLGLIVMAAVICLVPIIYCAVIALIGWGVWAHLTNDAGIFSHVRGRAALGALAIYLAPALAGILLIIFLLKPIFAPRSERTGSVELKEFEELKLHSFVQNVCAVVGAPAPSQITIDCDVNASAGFRRGAISMLRRTDLTLTIGLPLVAGMTKRQFAGILAHEFGHFAQGTGLRLTYIVRSMIMWMVRTAHERDAWDDWLNDTAEESGGWVALIVMFCKLCIGIGRLFMRLLALLTMLLCAFMLKQMEYDADRYEVQLGGSESFAAACFRMGELNAAVGRTVGESSTTFNRARELPDNVPAMIAAMARRLTPEDRAEVRAERLKEKGSFFATHPATSARIAAAKKLDKPGLYTDEAPARELFGDFDAACRKATIAHWSAMLGPNAVGSKLVSVAGLTATSEKEAAREAILPRYLGFDPPTWRPVFPTISRIPDGAGGKALVERLRAARHALKEKAGAARVKVEQYRAAAEESLKWEHARAALDAGLSLDFDQIGLTATNRVGVSGKLEALNSKTADAAGVIDEAGELAMTRLGCALSLLAVPQVQTAVPDAAKRRARADALLAAMYTLRNTLPMARQVRHAAAGLRVAGSTVRNEKTLDAARKLLRPLSDDVRARLDDARRIAGGTPDPFAQASPDAAHGLAYDTPNMGESLVGATPAHREYDEIVGAGDLFVSRWSDTYRRALGELVEIAEGVEKSLAAQKSPQPTPPSPASPVSA
jgi:hypothetical protein